MTPNIDYTALGHRIKEARKAKNVTQEALASACSVSTSHLGHIERGSRTPSLDTLFKIAVTLDVSMDSLLFDSIGANHHAFHNIESVLQGKSPDKVEHYFNVIKILADHIEQL